LILISTLGITFSVQARYSERAAVDPPIRLVLGAFALVALLHPDEKVAGLACVPVLLAIGYWLLWRRSAESGEPIPATVLAPSFAEPDSPGAKRT
jgi:hypothetical protein